MEASGILYLLSRGPVKSAVLKTLLVDVITLCQEAGLEVVGTVCDQGAANQAVINSLVRDTAHDCLRKGFCLNDQDIIYLYDVPHLFKGVRNNLMTKDLHFEQKKIEESSLGTYNKIVHARPDGCH